MAELMKKIIIEKLKEGWTEEMIIDFFVQRYGKEILLYPGNPIINYVPFFLLFLGLITLVAITKRKKIPKQ